LGSVNHRTSGLARRSPTFTRLTFSSSTARRLTGAIFVGTATDRSNSRYQYRKSDNVNKLHIFPLSAFKYCDREADQRQPEYPFCTTFYSLDALTTQLGDTSTKIAAVKEFLSHTPRHGFDNFSVYDHAQNG
jgi:hypothetical protein